MTGIVWKDVKNDPDAALAESNGFVVGHIVKNTRGVWVYRLDAFSMRRVTEGYGEVATKAQAKRSFMRAWRACLETLGLERKSEGSDE